MRRTLENWEDGVSIGGVKITNLSCADDTTLLAATEAEITSLLSRIYEISKDICLLSELKILFSYH